MKRQLLPVGSGAVRVGRAAIRPVAWAALRTSSDRASSSAAVAGSAILAIHHEGDPNFEAMARGYPDHYVNVEIGRWEVLTGEMD